MNINRSIRTAKLILQDKGEKVLFTKQALGNGIDPITGVQTFGEEIQFTANAYPSRYMSGDVNGSDIQASDIRLITERTPQRPEKGFICEVDEVTYRVMDVKHIRKSGEDVLYICQLRAN